jgi:MFS family permease
LSTKNPDHVEAVSSTGQSAVSIQKVFPILALSVFTSLIGMGIIVPLIPVYIEKMNVTGIWVGILFAVYSGTRVLMAPFIGRLSDRRGRKPCLCAGLIFSVVASLGYIWAANGWQLVLVRIFHGAAGGMVYPIAMSYIGDLSPEGKEGTWMGYFSAVVFTAFGIGPLLSGVLTENFGMTVTFASMSGVGLLSFLIALVWLPESQPKQAAKKARASFRAMASSKMIQGLFVYRLTLEGGWGAYIGFLSVLAGVVLGMSPTEIGVLITANVLISSFAMIPFGKVSDRVNKKGMIIVSGVLTAASLTVMPFSGGFWPLLALNIFAGIVGAAEFPASSALTITEGRRFGMGSTVAVMTMSTSAGMVVGPLLGGVILEVANINSVFYFAGGIMVLGLALFTWLSQPARVRQDVPVQNVSKM